MLLGSLLSWLYTCFYLLLPLLTFPIEMKGASQVWLATYNSDIHGGQIVLVFAFTKYYTAFANMD